MIVLIHAVNGLDLEATLADRSVGWLAWLPAALISRMGIGVLMFFVISGYCIAATADSSRRKPAGYKQFFIRRVRRIFPPYWALLVLSIVLVTLVAALGGASIFSEGSCRIPHAAALTPFQWLGNISLTESWRYHLSGDVGSRLLLFGPAWSLCYEEQFYAVCGLILLLAPRSFFSGIAGVTLFTIIMIGLKFPHSPQSLAYFFFDGRWLLFAAGVGVYYIVNYASEWRGSALKGLAISVLALFVVRYGLLATAGDDEQRQRMYEYMVGAGFAFMLLLLRPWDQAIADSKLFLPIQFCGKICYSLYLIHWPVTIVITHSLHQAGVKGVWSILFFVAPLATAASIAAAWLFYWLVEQHFINPPSAITPRTEAAKVPEASPLIVETAASAGAI